MVNDQAERGLWSAEVKFTTDSDVPGQAPTLLRLTALTSHSINITWQRPNNINGELRGYKVRHKRTTDKDFNETKLSGPATWHELSSLEQATEYQVRVLVYNDKGDGPPSNVETISTKGGAPPVLVKEQCTSHLACPIENTAVLRCYATSNVEVSYSWRKDGKPLTTTGGITVDKNYLVVRTTSERDFGTYTCRMTNRYGSIEHQTQLQVLAEKGPFSSPVVSAVVGSISPLLFILLIVVVLLLWRMRRNGQRIKTAHGESRPPFRSEKQPTDAGTYMDLQPVAAPTYQTLHSSSKVGSPSQTYEEVAAGHVNPRSCSDYEIPA